MSEKRVRSQNLLKLNILFSLITLICVAVGCSEAEFASPISKRSALTEPNDQPATAGRPRQIQNGDLAKIEPYIANDDKTSSENPKSPEDAQNSDPVAKPDPNKNPPTEPNYNFTCDTTELPEPKLIRNQQELQNITKGFYRLANDIALQGEFSPMTPIGSIFIDGNNYRVRNMTITRADQDHIAMFTTFRGCIADLTLENVNISGRDFVASYVAQANNVAGLRNVKAQGTLRGRHNVGGIIGERSSGGATVSDVKTTITIISTGDYVGGIVGHIQGGGATVKDAESIVNINSTGDYVGGIAGHIQGGGANLTNTKSQGQIRGRDRVGGLAGQLQGGGAHISTSTSEANVQGRHYIGGLAGWHNGGSAYIYDSHGKGIVQGENHIGGLAGWMEGGGIYIESSTSTGLVQSPGEYGTWVGGGNGPQIK